MGNPGPTGRPSAAPQLNPFGGFRNIATGFPLSGGSEISNLAQLADWLVTNAGLSGPAAAGISSVVAGESTGDPEAKGSGGDGLIGWTPPSTGPGLTGNATADMESQAKALVAYGKAHPEWGSILASNDAHQAAQLWSQAEAPAVPGSDIRANLIPQIQQAMKNPYAGATGTTGSGFSLDPFGPLEDIIKGPFQTFDTIIHAFTWFFNPENWVRIIAGLVGFSILTIGVTALVGASK